MLKNRFILLLLSLLIPLMLVACSDDGGNKEDENNKDNEVENIEEDSNVNNQDNNTAYLEDVTLNDFKTGAIFVYSSKKDKRDNFIREFLNYSKEYQVPVLIFDIDNEEDLAEINAYLSQYEDILSEKDRFLELERKIFTPTTDELEELRAELNKMFDEYDEENLYSLNSDLPEEVLEKFFSIDEKIADLEYEISLELNQAIEEMNIKTHELHHMDGNTPTFDNINFEEELKEQLEIVTRYADITIDEIIEYLQLNDKMIHNSRYFELVLDNRYKETPVVFVVTEGFMHNIITHDSRLLPTEEDLENPNIVENVMLDIVGFHLNQPSDQAEKFIKKIENENTFVALLSYRYCFECEDIEEILVENLSNDDYIVVDFSIAQNQRELAEFTYANQLEALNNPPMLIKVEQGKIIEILELEDLVVEEEDDEGFIETQVLTDKVIEFISFVK